MTRVRRPILAKLHTWVGIVVAVPLLLIALTGTILLFKDSLFLPSEWRNDAPGSGTLDAETARLLALPALKEADSISLARGVRAFHVVTGPDGTLTYWRAGAESAEALVPARLRIEHSVLDLHETLLLGNAGDVVVRVIGPVVATLLLIGVVLWWPLRRGWRARDLLPAKSGQAQLLRAHLALGSAAAVLLVVHASTGAMMANNPSIRAWLKPLTDPKAARLPEAAHVSFEPGNPSAAILSVRSIFPRGEITQLTPSAAGAEWSLKLRLPGESHPNGRSSVTIDLAGGRILSIRDAREAGPPGRYDDIVFPLHVGTLMGTWQRYVWAAGGASLVLLILLGAISFLRRAAR